MYKHVHVHNVHVHVHYIHMVYVHVHINCKRININHTTINKTSPTHYTWHFMLATNMQSLKAPVIGTQYTHQLHIKGISFCTSIHGLFLHHVNK